MLEKGFSLPQLVRLLLHILQLLLHFIVLSEQVVHVCFLVAFLHEAESAASGTVWLRLVGWSRVIAADLPLERSVRVLPEVRGEPLWALLASKACHELALLLLAFRKRVCDIRFELRGLFAALAFRRKSLIGEVGSGAI